MASVGSPIRIRDGSIILISSVAFALIFAARLVFTNPVEPITFLMVVPIGLLGAQFCLRGGLIGAGIASGLVVLWDLLSHPVLSPFGYTSRFLVFFLTGLTVGLLTSAQRQIEDESNRLRLSPASLH